MPTISNLPSLTTASDYTMFPVVDTWPDPDVTKKATFSQLKSYLEGNISVRSVAGRTGDVTLSYTDVSGLSTVAHSGSFNDLLNKPSTFAVTTATASTLGGVRIGSGISVTSSGTISVTTYSLVTATSIILGGVKIGSGITVTNDGTISTNPLVTATSIVLGGIKIGAGLNIDNNGVVTVNTQSSNVLAAFLTINGSETSDHVSANTGTIFWQTAGLVISRGSNEAARIGYTDDYTINNGTNTYPGIFVMSVGTLTNSESSGLVINNLRISPDVSELNIFGSNNPSSVISVKGTTNYENNVTHDDHIPNKKYVDDLVAPFTTASITTIVTSTHASVSSFGSVKIGSGVNVTGGTISVTPYSLVSATSVTLGGVKIGSGISISGDGTISATTATPYTLVTATVSTLGGVKIGTGISITGDGTISATTATPYTLPIASPSELGGVKIGSGISIDGHGVISSSAAFTGGSVANSTQFTDSTASSNTTTGAVTVTGGLGVQGNVNVGKNLTVWNTVTAQSFVYAGVGTPEVYSASNLNLTAVGRVQVTQSPFKVWNVTTSERDAISASNGDIIYNTDDHKFQGYANGTWKDITA